MQTSVDEEEKDKWIFFFATNIRVLNVSRRHSTSLWLLVESLDGASMWGKHTPKKHHLLLSAFEEERRALCLFSTSSTWQDIFCMRLLNSSTCTHINVKTAEETKEEKDEQLQTNRFEKLLHDDFASGCMCHNHQILSLLKLERSKYSSSLNSTTCYIRQGSQMRPSSDDAFFGVPKQQLGCRYYRDLQSQ